MSQCARRVTTFRAFPKKAIKYAEGALTADEYEPDRQARADARTEINRLEASL